jgi:hypothetical protein
MNTYKNDRENATDWVENISNSTPRHFVIMWAYKLSSVYHIVV